MDIWEVLLAIADLAGGGWPQEARAACLALSNAQDDDESLAEMLLADIHIAFDGAEKMFTVDLLKALNGLVERPWSEIQRGMPLTGRGLAGRLKDFGIKPGMKRIGSTGRGYLFTDFTDAWERHLRPTRNSVTTSQETAAEEKQEGDPNGHPSHSQAVYGQDVTGVTHVTGVAAKEGKEARQSEVLMSVDWETVIEEETHVE